eukprot:6180299-Pleurochrysis_carterae.AAC.1
MVSDGCLLCLRTGSQNAPEACRRSCCDWGFHAIQDLPATRNLHTSAGLVMAAAFMLVWRCILGCSMS